MLKKYIFGSNFWKPNDIAVSFGMQVPHYFSRPKRLLNQKYSYWFYVLGGTEGPLVGPKNDPKFRGSPSLSASSSIIARDIKKLFGMISSCIFNYRKTITVSRNLYFELTYGLRSPFSQKIPIFRAKLWRHSVMTSYISKIFWPLGITF